MMSRRIEAPAITGALHPLDNLSVNEMARAAEIVKADAAFRESMRFVSIVLNEPAKDKVLNFSEGDDIPREAFIILLDHTDGRTYEIIASLNEEQVRQFTHIPGVQPPIIMGEFAAAEALVKSHPKVHDALRKRGIIDFDLVTVEVWPAGNYGEEEENTRRIARGMFWANAEPGDNHFARPIDNLIAIVDLNIMEVIRVEDHGVIPVPQESGDYATRTIESFRSDVKPLDIVQPEGVSFTVNGYEVRWQKWQFRVGFTHREGLVLHQIGYEDNGRVRPIIYRASLAEMTVPYGDASITQYRKNAFDGGEFGMGLGTNALEMGCDCLGEIFYFDAALCKGNGDISTIPNAICLHEEDAGILWKHVDTRTGHTEVRRSRRLVISFIATVGNYEYGFYWYFYQDGTIALDIKMTGILQTAALPPGETTPYGMMLNDGLYAPHHQHIFCIRMDMAIDGQNNTVVEVDTVAQPTGPDNPYGNAFYPQYTRLKTEKEAQRVIDPYVARYWQIQNDASFNKVGRPVAYKLVPGSNPLPFAQSDSSIARRGSYMWKHLWVTPYDRAEKYPAGDYPNQHPGDDGLPRWTESNRSVENTDLVLWYVLGAHHIVRLEDWPVMPVEVVNFTMKPSGFFDESPALDVPPSHTDHCQV